MRKLFYLFFLITFCNAYSQSECGPAGYTGKKTQYYYNTTKPERVESYQDGMLHGEVTCYYKNGEIMQKQVFKLGKLVETPVKIDYQKKYKLEEEERKKEEEKWKNYKPAAREPVIYKPQPVYHQRRSETKNTADSCSVTTEFDYKNRKLSVSEKCTSLGTTHYEHKSFDTLGQLLAESLEINGSGFYAKEYYPNGQLKKELSNDYKTGICFTNEWSEKHYLRTRSYTYSGHFSGHMNSCTIYWSFDSIGRILYRKESSGNKIVGVYYNYDELSVGKCIIVPYYYDKNGETFSMPTENYVEGRYDKKEFITEKIVGEEREVLLEKGKGKFSGPYWMVAPQSFFLNDTIHHPKNAGYVIFIQGASNYNINFSTPDGPMFYDFYIPTCSFTMAKGHFTEGKKTGKWEFTNSDHTAAYYGERWFPEINSKMNGRYENGIRTGDWKYTNQYYSLNIVYNNGEGQSEPELHKQKKKDNLYDQYPGEYEDAYRLPMYHIISGKMNNEFPDGSWTYYRKYPEKISARYLFRNGNLLGPEEEYFNNGKLRMKAVLISKTALKPHYYSPEGDLLPGPSYNYELKPVKDGKPHGKYLKWDHTGKILEKGAYANGGKTGEWISSHYWRNTERYYSDIESDTSVLHYRNDTLNGSYFYQTNYLEKKGSYLCGKEDGKWIEIRRVGKDTIYTEEMYDDGLKYLLNHSINKKQYVKNGNGSVKTPGYINDLVIEDFYVNGRVVKTVNTYTLTNHIESITYKTAKGDSLAYYLPKEGGTCIKDGTGAKSVMNDQHILQQVLHYKKGKLVQVDYYNNGQFSQALNFYTSSDSAYNYKTANEPLITRKTELTSEGPLVTVKIYNLKPGYKSLRIMVSANRSIVKFIETSGFVTADKPGNTYYTFSNPGNPGNEASFSFYLAPGELNYYYLNTGCSVSYYVDKKRKEVNLFNKKSGNGI